MIPVSKPFLPPAEEYIKLINDIFDRHWLTNNGPIVNELELQLKNYLGVDHLLFMNNGTTALQIAIRALNLSGDIITTPFSFVATTSSIVWEGCNPVFVDIDPLTFNIDANKIEEAITPKTSAILATHVYGNPCDIEAIYSIAQKHNLKIIYDAAHCFGTKYKGESVFKYGDISISSFHATKIFHTIEGGAVFTNDPGLLKKMAAMRNFGIETTESFSGIGINGKNSEVHAAMGLLNLKYIDEIKKRRKNIYEYYSKTLLNLNKDNQLITGNTEYNYAYYPILLPSEEILIKMVNTLNLNWVYPRRYFYPTLDALPYVNGNEIPIARDIAKRILCLPLYDSLSHEEVSFISRLLLRTQNN